MKMTRITTYTQDGKFTGCEHIYARNQYKAIEWFKHEYPEHSNCIIVAEDYDPDKNPSHFKACSDCGCVHYW